ncbi:MAG: ribosome assembly cofactor RimP [Bacteroides sp.]|nr:ribosome assembly cofactor RimP [Bacteroides sp.]
MIDGKQIESIVNEYLEGTDKFLVSVNVRPGNRVLVLLDGEKGIQVADCALLSKHIESFFDRDTEDFDLEVSSVGVGSPLKMKRQYHINVGRQIMVMGHDLRKTRGKLVEVLDEGIRIEKEATKKKPKKGEPLEDPIAYFAFNDIREARIQVSFSKE